jgi:hypothetical protein
MRFILFIFTVLFCASVWAGSIQPNLDIQMGELTGAGSKFSIRSLAGFVHPKGYIMVEDCSSIVLKDSIDPKISDVVNIVVSGETINVHELKGFIVKK